WLSDQAEGPSSRLNTVNLPSFLAPRAVAADNPRPFFEEVRGGSALALDYPLTAIISDLHANVPALETALADARARGTQRFVCLGDMVGYGADPCFALD